MNSMQSYPPHVRLLRVILLICGFTLLLSAMFFAIVLAIQRSVSGSGSWDFQGASGAAVVIPSFAGVVLAAWAIYLQMRSNSPSYRAAELAWFEVSKLYRKVLRVSLRLWATDTEDHYRDMLEPTEEELAAAENQELQLDAPWLAEQREAEQKNRHAFRREFDSGSNAFSQESSTLLDLAVSTFPVLDALQEHLSDSHRVNLADIEASLYRLSVSMDFAERDTVIAARSVLRTMQELIERLDASGALELNMIERALWKPHQAAELRARFEDDDALKEALAACASKAPSETAARLRALAAGSSGARSKTKVV
jgi:hypothetical protein